MAQTPYEILESRIGVDLADPIRDYVEAMLGITTPEEPVGTLPILGNNIGMLSNNPLVYPGIEGRTYHATKEEFIAARADKGMGIARMPVAWARYQRFQGDPFSSNQPYVDETKAVLDRYHAHGVKVIVDQHSSFRLGDKQITRDGTPNINGMVDFWNKFDAIFGQHPAIWAYGITNEPHGIDDQLAYDAFQAVITAINKRNPNMKLTVGGFDYSDAYTWPQRSDMLKNLEGNNIIFEAHKYLFRGGNYATEAEELREEAPDRYIQLFQPFFDWLDANNKTGIIGEFSAPYNSPSAILAAENLIKECIKRKIPLFWWADGPGWPDDYKLSLTSGGSDYIAQNDRRTLLDMLEKYYPVRVDKYNHQ